jgi:hypothetical protein
LTLVLSACEVSATAPTQTIPTSIIIHNLFIFAPPKNFDLVYNASASNAEL